MRYMYIGKVVIYVFDIKFIGGMYLDKDIGQTFSIIEIVEPLNLYKVYYEDDSVILLTDNEIQYSKLETGEYRYEKLPIFQTWQRINWIMYCIQLITTGLFQLSFLAKHSHSISFWLMIALFFTTTYMIKDTIKYLYS